MTLVADGLPEIHGIPLSFATRTVSLLLGRSKKPGDWRERRRVCAGVVQNSLHLFQNFGRESDWYLKLPSVLSKMRTPLIIWLDLDLPTFP